MRVTLIIMILTLVAGTTLTAQTSLTLSSQPEQTIDGFGASQAFCPEWITTLDPADQEIVYNLLFSDAGANLSIVRSRIAPRNDGYDAYAVLDDEQQYQIMSAAAIRGVTRFYSTPWSPPAIWKTTGNTASGFMNHAYFEEYAQYLTDYILGYEQQWLHTITDLGIQHEPDRTGIDPEGCQWSTYRLRQFITILDSVLAGNGLSTCIVVPSASGWNTSRSFTTAITGDPDALAGSDIFASHEYTAGTSEEYDSLFSGYGRPVWMSEYGVASPFSGSIINALDVSGRMLDDLSDGNVTAWFYRWCVCQTDNRGLIRVYNNSITIPKRFYAFSQVSRFVEPGARRLPVDGNDSPVRITAFLAPDNDSVILIASNSTTQQENFTLDASGFACPDSTVVVYRTSATEDIALLPDQTITGEVFSFSCPAQSVTTWVLPLSLAEMTVTSVTSTQPSTDPVNPGATDCELLTLDLVTEGAVSPLHLTGLELSLGTTTDPNDIASVSIKLFHNNSNQNGSELFGSPIENPTLNFTITGDAVLEPGITTLKVLCTLAADATQGNLIDCGCVSLQIGDSLWTPQPQNPAGSRMILAPIVHVTADFEDNVPPDDWEMAYVQGSSAWISFDGGHNGFPDAAASGSANALFYHPSTSGAITRLITPVFDFGTAIVNPTLSFQHAQAAWGDDQDLLRVYYQSESEDPWELLASYTEDAPVWTRRTLTLPGTGSACRVAFEAEGRFGYGVCLDDVVIQSTPQPVPMTLQSLETSQPTTRGVYTGEVSVPLLKLLINTTGLIPPLVCTQLEFDTGLSTSPSDLIQCRLLVGGTISETTFGDTISSAGRNLTFTDSLALPEGITEFTLWVDVDTLAVPESALDAGCLGITLSGQTHVPSQPNPPGVVTVLDSLSGTFYVDATGNQTRTFNTLQDAFETLESHGISGATVLQLEPYTYQGPFYLGSIPGSGANQRITFTTLGEAFLTSTADDASDNGVLQLDNARHCDFSGLSFITGSGVYARAVTLSGNCEDTRFSDCAFEGTTASWIDTGASLFVTSSTIDGIRLQNCEFTNGYCGIEGSAGLTGTSSWEITGCTFTGQRYTAVKLFNPDRLLFTDNVIEKVDQEDDEGFFRATIVSNCDSMYYEANRITVSHIAETLSGPAFYSCSGTIDQPGVIANNAVSLAANSNATTAIRLDNSNGASEHLLLAYNSVNIHGNDSLSACLRFTGEEDWTGVQVLNNALASPAGGRCLIFPEIPSPETDFNDLYTTGSVLAEAGDSLAADLSHLQAITLADSHSISADPLYSGNTALAPLSGSPLFDLATPLDEVTLDILNRPRDEAHPSIGAWEVTTGTPEFHAVVPDLSVSLLPDQSLQRTITLSNDGSGELEFTASISYPARNRVRAQGGPDDFGYWWIDSDQTGGPAWDWIDISDTGTLISLTDESCADVTLPFTFPFYGIDRNVVRICSNGYLTFAQTDPDNTSTSLPDPSTPNGLIAPFWEDLAPASGTIPVYCDSTETGFTVQFDGAAHYGDTSTLETFQVILRPDGRILFQYMDVGDASNAVAGIENDAGDDGLHITTGPDHLHDHLAIWIGNQGDAPTTADWLSIAPSGGILQAASRRQLTLNWNATRLPVGTHQAFVTIEHNDPSNPTLELNTECVVSDPISISDLGLWYTFSSHCLDISGNDRWGTPVGIVYAQDRFGTSGSALRIDQTTDYMDIPDLNDPDFTLSFWINPVSGTDRIAHVVSSATQDRTHLYINPATGETGLYNQTAIPSTATLSPGVWHHLALAQTGTSASLYIHGALCLETASGIDNSLNPISLIGNGSQGNAGCKGSYDEFRYYARELTETEILQLYEGYLTPPGNLDITCESDSCLLSWESVTGATGYRVFQADSPEGPFTMIAQTQETFWSIPVENRASFYRVTAFANGSRTRSRMTGDLRSRKQ